MINAARSLVPSDDDRDPDSGQVNVDMAPLVGLTAQDPEESCSGRPVVRAIIALTGSVALTAGVMVAFELLSRGWH